MKSKSGEKAFLTALGCLVEVIAHPQRAVAGARVSIVGHSDVAVTGTEGTFTLPAHAADGQQVQIRVEKDGYAPALQWHLAGKAAAMVVIHK